MELLNRQRVGFFATHVGLFPDTAVCPILPTGDVYTLIPWAGGISPAKVFRCVKLLVLAVLSTTAWTADRYFSGLEVTRLQMIER